MSEPTSVPNPDPSPSLDPARERCVEELAEAYLEQLQAGAHPDRAALLSAHPDLGGALESRLDLVEVLLHFGRTSTAVPVKKISEARGSSSGQISRSITFKPRFRASSITV